MVTYTRIGPVYLWWSEYSDSAVIGPSQGAWGGDDIWHCEQHPDWQGESAASGPEHAAEHGYFVRMDTGVTP
jgi:hypothetical protein